MNWVKMDKTAIAVLLMAYGSPETIHDVGEYYRHIRGTYFPSNAPHEKEIDYLKSKYQQIGGRSPLLEITRQQAKELQSELGKIKGTHSFNVYFGMKHWRPFIEDAMGRIYVDGISRIIAIVLAPHYSEISIGGYIKSIKTFQAEHGNKAEINFIKSWHLNEFYLNSIANNIKSTLKSLDSNSKDEVPLVFTAHSIPKNGLLNSDIYQEQLAQTCQSIAKLENLKKWQFAFQSKGSKGEWLGPDIRHTVKKLSQENNSIIVICPIGFVSDNLEILYDIDIECQNIAKESGAKIIRTRSLNTNPTFIKALSSVVMENL